MSGRGIVEQRCPHAPTNMGRRFEFHSEWGNRCPLWAISGHCNAAAAMPFRLGPFNLMDAQIVVRKFREPVPRQRL